MRGAMFLLLTVLPLFGCSSAQQKLAESSNLSIESVETIQFGKTTASGFSKLIGNPTRIIHLKRDLSSKDAWIYSQKEGEQDFERLGLLVDRQTGLIESATWTVTAEDPLHKKDSTLDHFKSAKFTANTLGWDARDHFSEDTIFSDPLRGIFVYVDSSSQTVKSISFSRANPSKLAERITSH